MPVNRKNISSFILIVVFLSMIIDLAGKQLAFPTAEGAGCYSAGGRGGVVYEVTNLNDSGPGSLRAAVEAYGPRTVVFRVSGTIKLEKKLKIGNAYITIAGQTAPGDGICLRDYPLEIDAHNVIIRYMRFRLGDQTPTGEDFDAIWGRYRWNIIIDHCSASWSVDETLSHYGADSLTVQWCIVSESLYYSHHEKGAHGYGGIWGGKNASFHHNLIAHHSSRNPRFSGGETSTCVNVDFRNNVVYNWGFNSVYGGEGGTINMVGNYYKAGPATKSSVRYRIVEPSDGNGRWFVEGNYVDGYPGITENNWSGGVQGAYVSMVKSDTAFTYVPINEQNAEEAYQSALDYAGANLPVRDSVDQRVINDVRTGTAACDGYYYEIKQGFSDTSVDRGIIDSQNDVGGWPVLHSTEPLSDSDHDGIPDFWEIAHGLNPNDDSDRNIVSNDGYTRLEDYLNSLVGEYIDDIDADNLLASKCKIGNNYPNPFNAGTTIELEIPVTGNLRIDIYNLRGEKVRQLYNQKSSMGVYRIYWDGKDENDQNVTTGIYFCVFRFGDLQKTVKMQLIR